MPAAVVTVVVPVRDGQAFIATCWETLCRQTRRPDEVVFVDDASADASLEMLHELPRADMRRLVLTQPQAGPAAARNAGIRAAAGELIAFLDVDDTWPDSKLERALHAFRDHPQAEVVRGLVAIVGDEGGAPVRPELLVPHRRLNLGASVFRRSVFDRCGPFDATLRYGEDVEFFCRMQRVGVSIVDVGAVALHYRLHPGNMTSDVRAAQRGLFEALAKSLSAHGRGATAAKEQP